MANELQPLDGAQRGRRARGGVPSVPEKVPWSQTEANIGHGLSMLLRLAIGAVAFLLGVLLLWVGVKGAGSFGAKGTLPPPQDLLGIALVCGPLAPLFLAFAGAQLVQCFWVAGDHAFDERLWARLSAPARGTWKLRMRAKGIWAYRLYAGVALVALVLVVALLWKPLLRGALAGRWDALLLLGLTAGAAFLAYDAWRRRRASATDEDATQWISSHRWMSAGPSFATDVAPWLLGTLLSFAAVAWSLTQPSTLDLKDAFYVALGLLFAFLTVSGLRTVTRGRRHGAPGIEVRRVQDRPLVLACTVKFVPPLAPEELRARWFAELRAHQLLPRGFRATWPWFEAHTEVTISDDGTQGRFQVRAGIPTTIPHPVSVWIIGVRRADRKRSEVEFYLPQDSIHLEEFPVP